MHLYQADLSVATGPAPLNISERDVLQQRETLQTKAAAAGWVRFALMRMMKIPVNKITVRVKTLSIKDACASHILYLKAIVQHVSVH